MELSQRVTVRREAKKVFLKFLKTFSSEKVFKPPEALGAKRRYSRRSRANALASAKGGLGEKQEFFPQRKGVWGKPRGVSPNIFGGSKPTKMKKQQTVNKGLKKELCKHE